MSVHRSPPESMGISTGKGGADVHIYGTVGHYSRRTRTYVAKTGTTQLNTYKEPNHREKNITQLRIHLAEGVGTRRKNNVRLGDERRSAERTEGYRTEALEDGRHVKTRRTGEGENRYIKERRPKRQGQGT